LGKLKRLLEYLNGPLNEFRVIGADDLEKMAAWVDTSAVHRDMKSHTRGVVSFGTGGASGYLPHAIWVKKFMEGQGYVLKENRISYSDSSP